MPRRSAPSTPPRPTRAPRAGNASPAPKPDTAPGSTSPPTPSPSTAVATSTIRSAPYTGAGRPPFLVSEPERVQRLIAAVRSGNYLTTACKLTGVSFDIVRDYLTRAESDTPDGIYTRFRQSLDAAEAEAEAESLHAIRQAGEKDWKAHAAFLGRRHRARWSEQPNTGESAGHGVTINIGIALPGTAQQPQVLEAHVVSVPELEE